MATLAELVRDFEFHGRPVLQRELEHHGGQSDARAAVTAAASWRGPGGRVHPRQRRMPRAAKQAASEALRRADLGSARFARFESLQSAVHGAIGSVHGIGDVAVYDVALRIGAFHGLLPSRVRMHAASRESAALLGVEVERRHWLEVGSFPKELRHLSPWEIERLLCGYREELERLSSRRLGASLSLVVASHVLGRSAARAA